MKSRTDNPHYYNDPNCNLMTDSQEKAEDCRIESRAIDFFGQFDDKGNIDARELAWDLVDMNDDLKNALIDLVMHHAATERSHVEDKKINDIVYKSFNDHALWCIKRNMDNWE